MGNILLFRDAAVHFEANSNFHLRVTCVSLSCIPLVLFMLKSDN